MIGKRIFIIDDEPDIREILQFNLLKDGFTVYTYGNPQDALNAFKDISPDLIVTDWLMPGMDGLEFCKNLKMNPQTAHIPVIMITCKSDEIDIVTALELGAEDYMVKPFGIKELAVRIKKVLRRGSNLGIQVPEMQIHSRSNPDKLNDNQIIRNALIINKDTYTAFLNEQKLNLTFAEFKLLELLAEKPGKVFTRSQIIENDYGDEVYVTERSVDVKIVGLRKKLGAYENMIETIRSVGYRFNETA
jgi:two-component system, OmpR family, alkaline phosphatase synthesis response regulator PhoP